MYSLSIYVFIYLSLYLSISLSIYIYIYITGPINKVSDLDIKTRHQIVVYKLHIKTGRRLGPSLLGPIFRYVSTIEVKDTVSKQCK